MSAQQRMETNPEHRSHSGGLDSLVVPLVTPANVDAYYANYAEYAKTLRAWLVAYGIGGPVLFLTNEKAAARLASAENALTIIAFFLIGVGLQVLGTVVNKWAAWHVYSTLDDEARANHWPSRFWCWVNKQTWFDILLDTSSIAAFAVATALLMGVFLTLGKTASAT
ncbi:hypothetical protein [Luteibacter sp. CQ10]|uniref:hypothetical protein n=1 Tax=Luteibacter sp. CQ10 TaxID=2805821 RepID=UPI0034A369E2